MRFKDFLKEKLVLIIGTILVITSVEILLLAYHIGLFVRI